MIFFEVRWSRKKKMKKKTCFGVSVFRFAVSWFSNVRFIRNRQSLLDIMISPKPFCTSQTTGPYIQVGSSSCYYFWHESRFSFYTELISRQSENFRVLRQTFNEVISIFTPSLISKSHRMRTRQIIYENKKSQFKRTYFMVYVSKSSCQNYGNHVCYTILWTNLQYQAGAS